MSLRVSIPISHYCKGWIPQPMVSLPVSETLCFSNQTHTPMISTTFIIRWITGSPSDTVLGSSGQCSTSMFLLCPRWRGIRWRWFSIWWIALKMRMISHTCLMLTILKLPCPRLLVWLSHSFNFSTSISWAWVISQAISITPIIMSVLHTLTTKSDTAMKNLCIHALEFGSNSVAYLESYKIWHNIHSPT